MRFARSAFVAGLATVATVIASDAPSSSDVLVLSQTNFTTTVAPEPLILVEFYAPWCGHCKALAPHYEEAATELLKENIKLAKVDCTVETDLCGEHQVEGYPTLKVFRKGTSSEYGGPRKTEGIISYMRKQALPALSTVTSANLTDFKEKDKVVAIAYVAEGDSASYGIINQVAEKHRDDFLFGVSHDEALAKKAGVQVPGLVLYRKFDEPEVKFDKALVESDIVDFLRSESIPIIDELGPDNFMNYAGSGKPLAYLFADPESKELSNQIEIIKPLAKANKGKLNFVWIDAVKFANHGKSLNIQGDNWPAFAIQDIENNLKFPLEDIADDLEKKVSEFVAKYNAGSLKPSIKSEPIPKDQDGPVFVLVADEFDKVILQDDTRDKLVEFYAPWCGHCKKLAPTYDTLGSKYASVKDKVLIAKMDVTANDVPPAAGFQVQSFPTIKFQPAGSKQWIDFEGDRSLDGFTTFITLNGKHKVQIDLDLDPNNTQPNPQDPPVHHEEL